MEPDRRLSIACLDLTSLGEADDDGAIAALCARAARPVPADAALHVAAVCIRLRFVPLARAALAGTGVRVACATGGFPDAAGDLAARLDEVRAAVGAGADEVDVPIDRALLADPGALGAELRATRAAAGSATWKAILETGALDPGAIPVAAAAAVEAGADFLKTSTGTGPPGATPEAVAALAAVVAGAERPVGLKVSGGVRTFEQAHAFLAIVRERLGPRWPDPDRFRFGASSLLEDLVAP
jgi:deoxyribose-phosphate aldolase